MMAADEFKQAALVAIDWGTSRLRARLVDERGTVLAEAESDEGIGKIDGGHEAVFERLVSAWPTVPAIMAGMIGSRQGWHEVPYVACPATTASLASDILQFPGRGGRPIAIVPGLMLNEPSRDGDVMRGEETQMIGVIDREPLFAGVAILPGTHSKWARIEQGTIRDFQTFITGELFELLAKKSFLRHSVAESDVDLSELPDFALGVRRTAQQGLPFLNALFSVRSRQLLEVVTRENNLAYLSGLVIGGEIAAAQIVQPIAQGTPIRIVAAKAPARAYRKALGIVGLEAVALDGDNLVHAGMMHIARAISILPKGAN